uniref:Uncharacterized protein n=1 Tax=Romanomermis culicivorax TaxID=13658 RepID=A0A915HGL3_ROMCU
MDQCLKVLDKEEELAMEVPIPCNIKEMDNGVRTRMEELSLHQKIEVSCPLLEIQHENLMPYPEPSAETDADDYQIHVLINVVIDQMIEMNVVIEQMIAIDELQLIIVHSQPKCVFLV